MAFERHTAHASYKKAFAADAPQARSKSFVRVPASIVSADILLARPRRQDVRTRQKRAIDTMSADCHRCQGVCDRARSASSQGDWSRSARRSRENPRGALGGHRGGIRTAKSWAALAPLYRSVVTEPALCSRGVSQDRARNERDREQGGFLGRSHATIRSQSPRLGKLGLCLGVRK